MASYPAEGRKILEPLSVESKVLPAFTSISLSPLILIDTGPDETNLDFANKITPTKINSNTKNAITVVLIKPPVVTSKAIIIIIELF